MRTALQRTVRHVVYDLRGGFVVRPLVIAAAIGVLGLVLPLIEERTPGFDAWVSRLPVLVPHAPDVAAGIFTSIIDAVMTVVSIVLSVMLVAITFAAIQFSPRVLATFVEDPASHRTIGVFLGTFTYCLFAYASRLTGQRTPAAAALGAMVLALVCNVALVVFVHHIARAINVNYATERIARETERIIDDMTTARGSASLSSSDARIAELRFDGAYVKARSSGYVRYVDTRRLRAIAKKHGTAVSLMRRFGHFVTAGAPVARLTGSRVTSELESQVLAAIDLGPARTMEQDVEFGLLQLVDIALRAMSPAVNDPGTAINCINQLGRLLAKLASRSPLTTTVADSSGVVRVVLPAMPFSRLCDVAFEQIVHYGKDDLAVSLCLQRTLADVAASTTDPSVLDAIRATAERAAGLSMIALPEPERSGIVERVAQVRELTQKQRQGVR